MTLRSKLNQEELCRMYKLREVDSDKVVRQ